MPDLDAGRDLLHGMGWALALGFAFALALAVLMPSRRCHKAVALAAVLMVPLLGLAWESWLVHDVRRTRTQAVALFEARCRTAGTRIYRTVDKVEGVLLMKRRAPAVNLANQYAMTDPYGEDLSGDGYALTFLWGRNADGHVEPTAPPPLGYRYVVMANEDGHGYTRFEAGKGPRDEGGVLPVLRGPAERLPRYAITWEDISSRADRDHWIAGSRLMILDTRTGEVLAERIGWMWDDAMGATEGARHPWAGAAAHACPRFPQADGGLPYRVGQTRNFAEQVLKPLRDDVH